MPRVNPYKPNNIVSPGMFVGRYDELVALEQCLRQTKGENAHSFLLHGERGIGKSSLLHYVKFLSNGDIALDDETFSFLTIEIELDSKITLPGICSRIVREMNRQIKQNNKFIALCRDVAKHIDSVEFFGLKLTKASKEMDYEQAIDVYVDSIERVWLSVKDRVDGIVILIDEADKAPAESDFGLFIKATSEKFFKRNLNSISYGISGLSSVIQRMKQSHESSVRNVAMYQLMPLMVGERNEVVYSGLKQHNKKFPHDVVRIDPEALKYIGYLSEGYPHFIQQIAWSAFEENQDHIIDLRDVTKSVHKEGGALDQLGQKYFSELFFDKIKSDDYRVVLQCMASEVDDWVSKKTIREKCKLSNATLDNAVRALMERHVIEVQEGKRGLYRLINRSFGVWIRVYTQRQVEGNSLATNLL